MTATKAHDYPVTINSIISLLSVASENFVILFFKWQLTLRILRSSVIVWDTLFRRMIKYDIPFGLLRWVIVCCNIISILGNYDAYFCGILLIHKMCPLLPHLCCSASGTSAVAIDNKIEQAMVSELTTLLKNHNIPHTVHIMWWW